MVIVGTAPSGSWVLVSLVAGLLHADPGCIGVRVPWGGQGLILGLRGWNRVVQEHPTSVNVVLNFW